MLGLAHETPSRLLRRIKDAEFDEMPTLPSPPGSSNTSRASDDSGMSNVPRRRRMPARGAAAASPLGDDSTRLKQGGSAGRRILSPLNANNKTNNVVSRDDSVDIDSPKSRPYISRKEATDNAKPKTSLTPPNNTQPQDTRLSSLATNTVVSKASSARTARPNARSPNTPLQRVNAGTAARTQEIVYSDESETTHSEDIQHSSVVEDVNNASLSGYQDPNSSVLNAQSLDKLDSSSFMQDLQNQQDASIEYETSEAGDDVSDTPVPRNIARFRPPSPILEENEDGSGHDEAPTSHFPLASGSEQAATSTSSVDGHTSTAGTDDEQLASAEKRIAMHVVMRRRANPVNRRPSQRVQVSPETPAQHVLSLHSSHGDVEEFSQSAYSSPGVGRRLPPSAEGKPPGRQSDHTPVRYVSPGSRTVSTSTAGTANSAPAARYASPSNFETPRPAVADSDLERRKSHLLSTLRLTALRSTMKPKFKRGTPHPLRNVQNRERSETPVESENISSEGQAKSIDAGQSREDHAEAYSEDQTTTMSQSSASSHDLTTYPRGNNGNMSLPLAGTGLDTAATRFNGAKLTTYLHALNTHLSEENQNLVKTLEQTAKEVQRLMRKNQELSSASGSTTTSYVGADGDEHDAGDTTSDRLQQHQRTSDDLAQLSQHLTGSVGGSNSHSRRMQELEQELEDHRAQLQQKDTVIDQLRKQVLQEQERDEDDTGTVTIAELQKQVFTLTDQMTQATADLAAQQAEAARLRVENIDAAGRHATAIAALQGRADELLDALEDREVALEEIENRLARTQDDHVESMKTLEDELTNVLTEQDEKVRAMEERSHQIEAESKVLREAKSSADARIAALEEQINRLQASTQKQANTDVEDSQTRELGILHERIASLQRSQTRRDAALKEKDDIIQANTRIQAATVDEHTQLIDDLRSQLKDALHVNQKNTDAMSADEQKLLEVQADLQDTEKEIQDLENQLEDAQLTISRLRQQNADSAMAMDSELRKQLRAAESEIGDLRNQLAAPYRNAEPNGAGNVSSQDLRIRTLEANNHELKSRVAQLRRQEAVNTMLTPARCTPDKSVRFDSVKSMRTPRSASDILGGTSFVDRSDGNVTVAPLYNRIDGLQGQVKHLQGLLQEANEDVDDKLRKLNRTGMHGVGLTQELEEARQRITSLEQRLREQKTSDANGGLSQQLEAVNRDLKRVSGQVRSKDEQISRMQKTGDEVAALKYEVARMKRDARMLGEDIQLERARQQTTSVPSFDLVMCTKPACQQTHTRLKEAKEGSKGLLVQIRYLNAKFTRESWMKADLAHQKKYLQSEINGKQRQIDATKATLDRFGMQTVGVPTHKITFRHIAHAALFSVRIQRLSKQWAVHTSSRAEVRAAYRHLRGHDLPC